jgi:hypothetical protein
MIFPVLFYHEGGHEANNTFQEALRDSLYTDQSWPGMACDLSQIGDCVVKPEQFGIDIFPAYVFLRRLPDDPSDAVMVKRIEGRALSAQEILDEIEDAYEAIFDLDNDGDFVDEDGDGKPDAQIVLPARPGFSLGSPFAAFFDCSALPGWFCRMKIGYMVLIIAIIALMVVIVRKA